MGSTSEKVLITGATGFLGGRLVRTLLEMGISVRALGRNLAQGLALAEHGAEFRPVALEDRAGMCKACEGIDLVVHSGALSSAWGQKSAFYQANVEGTANVIHGCLTHRVKRLVHISSPSVCSTFVDQFDLSEHDPLPETAVSLYSETKKIAERLVNNVSGGTLETVILRPKAIYGPGDNAIFPRLIEAISKKRLPIIGDGQTVTNLTHVDDVVSAILLAMRRTQAVGKTYFITGGEANRIWDCISELARRLGYLAPTKRLSVRKAMTIARAMEAIWKTLRLPSEPPLTRYKISTLVYSQTYTISAARRDLGYEPKIAFASVIDDLVAELRNTQKTQNIQRTILKKNEAETQTLETSTPCKVSISQAGTTRAPERFYGSGTSFKWVNIPALFAVIQHPDHGIILFDTGYSPRFFDGTKSFPFSMYRWATPVSIDPKQTAASQLADAGISPNQVRWIILSHFDPDHYGGLRDFPDATIVCSWRAWDSARDKVGFRALRERILPEHLPEDLSARLQLLADATDAPLGPFHATIDLFGDGSIRLVELPGHAPGQLGAFVTVQETDPVFLVADALWTNATLSNPDATGLHYRIARDKPAQTKTYALLREFKTQFPSVRIVPSHCTETKCDASLRVNFSEPQQTRAA